MIPPAGFQSQCCRKILNHIYPQLAQASAAETRCSSQPLRSPCQAAGWMQNFIVTSQTKGMAFVGAHSPSSMFGPPSQLVSISWCSRLLQVSFHRSYFLVKLDTFFSPVWVLPNPSESWQPTNTCSVAVFLHTLK